MTAISLITTLIIGISTPALPVDTVAAAQKTNSRSASDTLRIPTSTPAELDYEDISNRNVPFYSQFEDIQSPYWQKRGCGIASLAMLIDFYDRQFKSVESLLQTGKANGAYIRGAGWSHRGLIDLAQKHGLTGRALGMKSKTGPEAFNQLSSIVEEGPVIASVHYTFKPTNPIPHLAVINEIDGDTVYYNDPAEKGPGHDISKSKFMEAWKRRVITIRPIE